MPSRACREDRGTDRQAGDHAAARNEWAEVVRRTGARLANKRRGSIRHRP
jgi:hypothetical protein